MVTGECPGQTSLNLMWDSVDWITEFHFDGPVRIVGRVDGASASW